VERRAKKLKVDHLIQGAVDKVPAIEEILKKTGLKAEEVAYIGDDLADLPLLKRVGLSACPADAIAEAKAAAFYCCETIGGGGCVREFAERLLGARS
jgi:3-deoxy-D-manno-octulosonate 8-phosphate phosphatase (KDO 8-P phosphatase)